MTLLALIVASSPAAAAAEASVVGRTPPRLSLVEGDVSFWRPGAEDWVPARLNTALAPGDALYAGDGGKFELQVGVAAFVRGAAQTQLGLDNQEPDFLQFKVTSGRATLDLRRVARGHTVEIDTPNAAFTVEDAGYYRADIDQDTTTFITRRGGRARVTPAGGNTVELGPNDQVIVEGAETPRLATYDAPALDDWDRWNYDRTDHVLAAESARYLPQDVYGADTLDHYGTWRVEPPYGRVWVPSNVAPAWAPYSTGQWVWDPSYGWTWVDDAPWGWAPYHYGRWVYANRCWAWAPGPVIVSAVYAPALVAFFNVGHVRVGIGVPAISWVALGWGEPLVPWWGPVGFVGVPWWGGWGGPRIVTNVFVEHTTVINVFHNTRVPHAVVTLGHHEFGRGVVRTRSSEVDVGHLRPVHGALPVKPGAHSLVPVSDRSRQHTVRPPEAVRARRVVATRPPHDPAAALSAAGLNPRSAGNVPAPQVVSPGPHRPHGVEQPASSGRVRQPELQEPQRPTAPTDAGAPTSNAPQAPPPPPHRPHGAEQPASSGRVRQPELQEPQRPATSTDVGAPTSNAPQAPPPPPHRPHGVEQPASSERVRQPQPREPQRPATSTDVGAPTSNAPQAPPPRPHRPHGVEQPVPGRLQEPGAPRAPEPPRVHAPRRMEAEPSVPQFAPPPRMPNEEPRRSERPQRVERQDPVVMPGAESAPLPAPQPPVSVPSSQGAPAPQSDSGAAPHHRGRGGMDAPGPSHPR